MSDTPLLPGSPHAPPSGTRSVAGYRKDRNPSMEPTDAMVKFVVAFIRRGNATRAYMDAHPGVSIITARAHANRMANHPWVKKEIAAWRRDVRKQYKTEIDEITRTMLTIALTTVADVLDADGMVIPPQQLPREVQHAIKKVKREEVLGPINRETGRRELLGHTIEVEMHDKVQALKAIGQHLGIFVDQVRVTAPDDLIAAMQAARERARLK